MTLVLRRVRYTDFRINVHQKDYFNPLSQPKCGLNYTIPWSV